MEGPEGETQAGPPGEEASWGSRGVRHNPPPRVLRAVLGEASQRKGRSPPAPRQESGHRERRHGTQSCRGFRLAGAELARRWVRRRRQGWAVPALKALPSSPPPLPSLCPLPGAPAPPRAPHTCCHGHCHLGFAASAVAFHGVGGYSDGVGGLRLQVRDDHLLGAGGCQSAAQPGLRAALPTLLPMHTWGRAWGQGRAHELMHTP